MKSSINSQEENRITQNVLGVKEKSLYNKKGKLQVLLKTLSFIEVIRYYKQRKNKKSYNILIVKLFFLWYT